MNATANQLTVSPLASEAPPPPEAGSRSWLGTRVVILTAVAIVLDGFDNQTLSLSLPTLSNAWGVPTNRFAATLAFGILSMSAGSLLSGWLGDRFGTKRVLVLSLAIFGGATAATATADGLGGLLLLRMLTCIGLGAAIPNAIAIVSEFSSASRRAMTVTLLILCIPLGGSLASLVAAQVLTFSSWGTLFVLAGTVPMLFASVLRFSLPESPAFLARRLQGKIPVSNSSSLGHRAAERVAYQSPFAHVFSLDRRRDTFALWVALGASLSAVYSCYNWMPALLTSSGFSVATASQSMAYLNGGGIAGGLIASWLVTRFGSRVSMPCIAILGAMAVVPLYLAASHPNSSNYLSLSMSAEGFCLNGVQSSLFALVANAYDAGYRATGVGTVVGAARLSAIATSSAVAPLIVGEGTFMAYFAVLGALLVICAGAIIRVSRQIQGQNAFRLPG